MTPFLIQHGTPTYWDAVQLRLEVLRWPLGLEFTDEELDAEREDLLVGVQDGEKLVGTLVLTSQPSPLGPALKMRQVAVATERQGSGLGTAMVEFSEQIARDRGYAYMVLHARETAVPFYIRLGYDVIGEAFEEVGIPHLAMAKQL